MLLGGDFLYNETMKFSMPIPPTVNRIYRRPRFGAGLYKTEEAKNYDRYVKKKLHQYNPVLGPISVRLEFYFLNSKRDIDSGLKVLLDAMQGRMYTNDTQIKELHVYKLKDKLYPRVDIEIMSLEES